MADIIDQLLSHNSIVKNDPAPQSEIDAVVHCFELPLPESLLKLWRASAGLTISRLRVDLLRPAEVWELVGGSPGIEAWRAIGYLPVFYDRQSNYLTMVAKRPLAFRLAYVPHDDGSRLVYSNFDSCLSNLLRVVDDDCDSHAFFAGIQGDYPPDGSRSREDQEAGRDLLCTPNLYGEWNYAVQLLDSGNLKEWGRLLETDHFVRRDVRARMRQMQSPAISELLQNDQRAFDDVAASVIGAARQAGFDVGRRKADVVQISGKWMNLDGFFHRRKIPNAMQRMVDWIDDQRQGRNPHHRPGHFMAD
jgi:hypothetical protein